MVIKIHKIGDSKCIVFKQDGHFVQIRFIPSAWRDKYYVIEELLHYKIPSFNISLWSESRIIKYFGNAVDELFQ